MVQASSSSTTSASPSSASPKARQRITSSPARRRWITRPSDAPLNEEDGGARGEPQRAEMLLGHQLRAAEQRDGDDGRRQPAARAERDRGDRDRRDEEEARRVGRGQQARHLERRDGGEEQRDDGGLRPRAARARRVDRVEHAAQGRSGR